MAIYSSYLYKSNLFGSEEWPSFLHFYISARDTKNVSPTWSSGYKRRLVFNRSWVHIPAPDKRRTFLTLIALKIVSFLWKRPKTKKKESVDGPNIESFTKLTVFSNRKRRKSQILISLFFRASGTRWLDYVFLIWPMQKRKFDPKHKKLPK